MCHREGHYASLPQVLLWPTVETAYVDRVLCVTVLLVLWPSSPWHKLTVSSSLSKALVSGRLYIRVRNPLPVLLHVGA